MEFPHPPPQVQNLKYNLLSMCGIYGWASKSSKKGIEHSVFLDKLIHRGPDDGGLWVNPSANVVLGHRRLSILDLSDASRQPMRSPCGLYSIVFNGEIYNFKEIRGELKALGLEFFSSGDTEVVLNAYKHWGESCVSKFNGMFAFVIFDESKGPEYSSLFFARDRAGEKPFYYISNSVGFQFASELKALDHSGRIDIRSLNYYLSLGYIPGDMCLFEGVQKLPPAHTGRLNVATGELKVRPYWALPINRPDPEIDGVHLAQLAGDLIEDSVRLRLVADVPVGILLSGGLDSSIVTAAAARVSSDAIETFTIALPGSSLDEAHHAQKVADYFGTRHHVLPISQPSLDLLDGLAPFIDEPIADSSILPAWMVFGLAGKRVKVALGGDGGDELFGGYSDYTSSQADARRWGWVPSLVMKSLAEAAAQLPAGVRGRNRVASLRGGAYQQLIWGRPYFDGSLRRRLLKADAIADLGSDLEAPEHFLFSLFAEGADPLDSMTRTHFGSILPDDFLVKVDRASMARSLEVRAPFLDHRLIEFAFGKVPSHWKVHGGESRRLQRLLAKCWLPADLDINRKQGFSIPINEWLRNEGASRLMARMEGLPEMINLNEVRNLVRGHLAGRANGGRLFALIMLAIAMRNILS